MPKDEPYALSDAVREPTSVFALVLVLAICAYLIANHMG